MSILAVESVSNQEIATYLIWSGFGLLLAMLLMSGRSDTLLRSRHEPTDLALPLVFYAGVVFFIWIGAQIALLMIMHPGDLSQPIKFTPKQTAIISVVAPLAGLIAAMGVLCDKRMRNEIGLRTELFARGVQWGVVGQVIAYPLVTIVIVLGDLGWQAMGWKHPDEHMLLEAMRAEPSFWIRAAGVVSAIILAPLFEEFLFRGLVQTAFRKATGYPWIGIVIASGLFAFAHEGWTQVAIFALSIGIGIAYEMSGTIWAAIIMHACFNAYNVIISMSK